jgi:hypothetical protein
MKPFGVIRAGRIYDFSVRERNTPMRVPGHAGGLGIAYTQPVKEDKSDDIYNGCVYWAENLDDAVQLAGQLAYKNPGHQFVYFTSNGVVNSPPGEVRVTAISEKGIIPK